MHKCSINYPDCTVQTARSNGGGLPRWRILGSGGAQRLQPVEQEDEDPHYGDGGSDAGPDGEVKWCKQREDIDLLLRLPQQDAHTVI